MAIGVPRVPYQATLILAAVAADTPYVLVDLSDTTNFPHKLTNGLILKGLDVYSDSADFDVYVGVVIENDATNGTAKWIYYHKGSGAEDFRVPEHGLNLCVISGALTNVVSNSQQADNTNWQNDVDRVSPVGSTTKPGAGDLVVFADLTAGSGTLNGRVVAYYDAE